MTKMVFILIFVFVASVSAKGHTGHLTKRGIFDFASRFVNTEVCYEDVGCYSNAGPFSDLLRRPLNLLPQDPATMGIVFTLHTRANNIRGEPIYIDDEDVLLNSTFDRSNDVKIIVHGYLDNALFNWVKDMAKELTRKADYNVITVDWSRAALPPYAQAVANTRVVGDIITLMIKFLKNETGIQLDRFHIIGHSLGSHIAGYAGYALVGDLGRITGLDPAYPYFQAMPTVVRLDPTDAQFVDVIHTDSSSSLLSGMGIDVPIGHIDFYPNGGRDQPGCTASGKLGSFFNKGVIGGVRTFVACNHLRAMDYFTESINSDCQFTGFRCSNWDTFTKGECRDCGKDGSDCARLGLYADQQTNNLNSTNMKYYLKTNDEPQFCFYNYWIRFTLKETDDSTDITGSLFLTLYGIKGDVRNKKLYNGDIHLTHKEGKNVYSLLLTSMVDLGRIRFGSISWQKEPSLSPLSYFQSWLLSRKEKLYVETIEVFKMDQLPNIDRVDAISTTSDAAYSKLCNKDGKAVEEDVNIRFSNGKCTTAK